MNDIFSKYYTRNLLIVTAIITLIVFFSLRTFDGPLHNSVAPGGIVSFEFSKDFDSAKDIINSWDDNAKLNAGLSLGIDYLFLVAYSLFFSISIYLISKRFQYKFALLRKIGVTLATLILVAALCDAIENFALIKLLIGSQNTIFPPIAYYFASIKFIILGIGIIYILIGLIFNLLIRTNE